MITIGTPSESIEATFVQWASVAEMILAMRAKETPVESPPPPKECHECGQVMYKATVFRNKQQERIQWNCPNGHLVTESSLIR